MAGPGTAWPPPPDLASIRELVRAADPEGHLAEGAAEDEYEPEEDAIFASLKGLRTGEITVAAVLPRIERVWRESFAHSEEAMDAARPKLLSLAKEIERFFGADARPRTRGEILADEAGE